MEYVKLGNTGLDVSPICLGCMSFGTAPGWVHNEWALGEEDSRAIIQRALDLGINFFDTANVYAYGNSEEILGRAIRDLANRDEVVIATKVFMPMRKGPNGGGLSRKHILSQIDQSLKRLGMEYVDLYIIHRWDDHTPIEETMEALHDVVKAGKARTIGASAMYAWQFQKALYVAERHGWTRFVSMQNHYNLIYREDERELLPLCVEEKIALTPYSPLASGRLARETAESSRRLETDPVALQMALAEVDISIIGYFYAIDFGPGVRPQHHRVGKNAICTCYLGELCPAVDVVRAYLAAGGERAPEPPPGYYPVIPAKCPICRAKVTFDVKLSSKYRGAGWRCEVGGSAHYRAFSDTRLPR